MSDARTKATIRENVASLDDDSDLVAFVAPATSNHEIADFVHRNPLIAMIATLFFGILVGMLLTHPRSGDRRS